MVFTLEKHTKWNNIRFGVWDHCFSILFINDWVTCNRKIAKFVGLNNKFKKDTVLQSLKKDNYMEEHSSLLINGSGIKKNALHIHQRILLHEFHAKNH